MQKYFLRTLATLFLNCVPYYYSPPGGGRRRRCSLNSNCSFHQSSENGMVKLYWAPSWANNDTTFVNYSWSPPVYVSFRWRWQTDKKDRDRY